MTFAWSDAGVERLRQGIAEGESYSLIAADIGCTRNAAIGKAQRQGLAAGRKPGIPSRRKHRAKAAPVQRPPKALPPRWRKGAPMPRAEPRPAPIVCDAPEGGVDILALRRHHCRFIAGETEDARYCGATRVGDGPYCDRHARLCLATPQTRTEARIAADLRLHAARSAKWKKNMAAVDARRT